MLRVVKTLALGVSLLIGQQVLAQTVPSPQPVPFPATGIPRPGLAPGNGGLVVSIYDITNTNSLTLYTGLNYNDILPTTGMTSPSGLVLDFGEIAGFDEMLAAGSTVANLRYAVYAGDNDATGGATNTAIATTSVLGSNPTVLSSAVAASLGAIDTFVASINSPANACTANPCTVLDSQVALNAYLTGTLAPSAAVGSALGFYWIDHSGNPATPALDTRYQNSPTSFGQWLVSSTGNFQYMIADLGGTVIPLPAAVWLLLSGLAGFGVVRRRRLAA